jgi:hypothetical protein
MNDSSHETPTLCSRRMRRASQPYFALFSSDAMALLSEGTLLSYKTQTYLSEGFGLIWAAIRCVERGEARCEILRPLESALVERDYVRIIRKFETPRSITQVERHQFYNPIVVLPPRCRPDEPHRLECSHSITAGALLAAILAKFEFEHATNVPFWDAGIDPREAFEALKAPDGFVAHESLIRRGMIPRERAPLYQLASEMAEFIGSWIITSAIAKAAALRLLRQADESNKACIRSQWADLIRRAREHVSGDGCCFLISFPGPHPWTAWAAPILGLEPPPT